MSLIEKIRRQETPLYRMLYKFIHAIRNFTFPRIKVVGYILNSISVVVSQTIRLLKNQYSYQILNIKCKNIGKGLKLDGDLPLIFGDGDISIGNNVSIGNRQTWVVGIKVYDKAKLIIGDDTTINYQTLISVAKEVRIGSNCLFAGEIKIFDNNSHPTNYLDRRENKTVPKSGIESVHIEDDVWVGTQTIILKGVTIGKGSIIGAGSVVTKSVPPFSLVVGNPARVVRKLDF